MCVCDVVVVLIAALVVVATNNRIYILYIQDYVHFMEHYKNTNLIHMHVGVKTSYVTTTDFCS